MILILRLWFKWTFRLKLKAMYMCTGGFYTYSIFALIFWETRRSDFGVSMGHHVASVILISMSYICRQSLAKMSCQLLSSTMLYDNVNLNFMFVEGLLVLARFVQLFMMLVMCFLKQGRCLNTVGLMRLQAFHSFCLYCHG